MKLHRAQFSLQPPVRCTYGLVMFIFEKNPKNLQKPVEYTLPDGTSVTARDWKYRLRTPPSPDRPTLNQMTTMFLLMRVDLKLNGILTWAEWNLSLSNFWNERKMCCTVWWRGLRIVDKSCVKTYFVIWEKNEFVLYSDLELISSDQELRSFSNLYNLGIVSYISHDLKKFEYSQ